MWPRNHQKTFTAYGERHSPNMGQIRPMFGKLCPENGPKCPTTAVFRRLRIVHSFRPKMHCQSTRYPLSRPPGCPVPGALGGRGRENPYGAVLGAASLIRILWILYCAKNLATLLPSIIRNGCRWSKWLHPSRRLGVVTEVRRTLC